MPSLLTLIVPRHPERGKAIATLLARQGLRVARRGQGAPLTSETEVYLADSLGELGLFYRLAGLAFLGASLVPRGGHNPLEPARLDCAILHGPSTENFRHVFSALDAAGGARPVQDAAALANRVTNLLTDPAARAAMATAALRHAAAGTAVLDRVLDALRPHLPPLAPATDLLHART
jgi:3-deoxy-D-manno-octulosonic-acid transferase